MLRAVAAVLRARAVASTRPLALRRAVSSGPSLGPGLELSGHRHRPIPGLLLPATLLSRGITRMRRRSPPVRPKEEEEGEESGSESEDESYKEVQPDVEADEDGEESDEWEGFVLDLGADAEEEEKSKRVDEEP